MANSLWGKPRSKERILGVLKELQSLWEKYPDLRLGQLLLNSVKSEQELFYIEDEQLIEKVRVLVKG